MLLLGVYVWLLNHVNQRATISHLEPSAGASWIDYMDETVAANSMGLALAQIDKEKDVRHAYTMMRISW